MKPEAQSLWALEPGVVFLNHGSFGATPRAVLEHKSEWTMMLEREPVQFFTRIYEPALDRVRTRLAAFVGVQASALAFVTNATMGIGAVLMHTKLQAGDEILCTNHGYNATNNAVRFWAERSGAAVRIVDLPFQGLTPEGIVDRVMGAVGPKTRLALLDHVTSATAAVCPVEELVPALEARGVATLIDGAHGPGMLPLSLEKLGASFYVGNLHKWVCAPKGVAFVHVRRDRLDGFRPPVISHGANTTRSDRHKMHIEYDWMGTFDPSSVLCVDFTIDFIEQHVGWEQLRSYNHELVLRGTKALCDTLGVKAPHPALVGSMVALPVPEARTPKPPQQGMDPLAAQLWDEYRIEAMVQPWPAERCRVLRVTAQLYNDLSDYQRCAVALTELLARGE